MSNGKIEMSYEEYKETGKNILKDIFNMSKEDYEMGIGLINKIASYESKIEDLAFEIIPENKILRLLYNFRILFKENKRKW